MENEKAIATYSDIVKMSQALGKGRLFGKTADELLPLMLIAQAEGRHPAIAAQEYDIIQGKPAINSRAALARFQAAGGKIGWVERTDEKASAVFEHPSCSKPLTITWDMARAKQAGLTGKPSWKSYPAQMLSARVVSEGVRACFPACLSGFYTSEEVQDMAIPEGQPEQTRDVTPKQRAWEDLTLYEKVGAYIDKAEKDGYLSGEQPRLYREERETHANDDDHLHGMLTRIETLAAEAKKKLDKTADTAFQKEADAIKKETLDGALGDEF